MTATDTPTLAQFATPEARRGTASFEIADDGGSYTAKRLFGAPPARVFRAFTDPADIRRWYTSGAPEGSALTTCESDPTEGGNYHYVMEIPEMGPISWHGTYTTFAAPDHLAADEWFIMGEGAPEGPPTRQILDFVTVEGGGTLMTMVVHLGEPEDLETLIEESAAGLDAALTALDALISG